MNYKNEELLKAEILRRQKIKKRIILSILVALLICLIGAVSYAAFVILTKADDIDTANIYSQINQRTTLYDDEGREIENLYSSGGNRTLINFADIPDDMINAVVAIEDKTFWDHHGFNIVRMIGAIKERILSGEPISGTSTITQQLARNVFLSETMTERSMQRKILEAWYTVQLEKELSKEQIIEAYLNTVYFGFNSYGIEAAADNYFSKSACDLTTEECIALAALPQSPDTYALVTTDENGILKYNGDMSKERRLLVAKLMYQEGTLSKKELSAVQADSLGDHINVRETETNTASYYTDYAIDIAVKDLAEEFSISEEQAYQMVYTKGLKIYTCLNTQIQDVLTNEINNPDNYTGIASYNTDSAGNILNASDGSILARPRSSYIDDNGRFVFKTSEYKMNEDGSMTIYKGKRLALYEAAASDGTSYVTVSFRTLYTNEGGLSFIDGGSLNIPEGYTTFDNNENCVVSERFFEDYPEFFVSQEDKLVVESSGYTLSEKMNQPQAAAAIIENDTGELKAMVGGRGGVGRQLYNRAVNPRQPGSAIKPIAVYGPALQMSAKAVETGESMNLDSADGSDYGEYITAGSIINDAPVTVGGKVWPKNSSGGYQGKMTLRRAVEQSCNVAAYKVFTQIGEDYSIEKLKEAGITTIDEEGDTNDYNAAALALGGMTEGIKPLEMTAAYATFPNGGIYKEPKLYTKILDHSGNVLLEADNEETQVYSSGVAYIMTDILQTAVSKGTGSNAKIGIQPVGGKTGTTSDQYDIWFAGFTPQYSMALWEGNDFNIQLSSMSSAAASFWASIMKRVCTSSASFRQMPSSVEKIAGEYYIKGTMQKIQEEVTTENTETESEVETTVRETDSTEYEDESDDSDNWEDYFD